MKVGVICGRERTFPDALIETINGREGGITAEMVRLGSPTLEDSSCYRVIVDRISHEVPFYRCWLEQAVTGGTVVINNPFWWTADNKYFECVLATRLGVAVPRTALVPNRSYEADIIEESLRNLIQPPPWDDMVKYTGLPAVLKPAMGGGSKNIHVVRTMDELIQAWESSGHLQMILQEFIDYEAYVRCFAIGREHVKVSKFDIKLPRENRYFEDHGLSPEVYDRVVENCLVLTRALGYDMDTLEFAIRGGIPYAIDFLNPAPDCEPGSVKEYNFRWVLQHLSDLVLRYAREGGEQPSELSWQRLLDGTPTPVAAR